MSPPNLGPSSVAVAAFEPDDPTAELAGAVRQGLGDEPKWLPSKYFYDAYGSRLYEKITDLPEYYPYRAERALLEREKEAIVAAARPQAIVELGSGSASKTRLLLDAAVRAGTLEGFGAVEVSETALRASLDELRRHYPDIDLQGVLGDFNHWPELPFAGRDRLVLFLGSTIGNFEDAEIADILARVGASLGRRDTFLVGFDLVKDVAVLEAAYNDSQGVTAAFNRNLLRRLNRELGCEFHLDRFRHRAFYDRKRRRIEMHLVATVEQRVSLGRAGGVAHFAAGESIHTEISRKFTADEVTRLASDAGLHLERWISDREGRFGLAFLTPSTGAAR
ncbi:MAG: L-histidine N(alpha)-methyltransferase [Acidobacteriota bacterium]